MEQIQMNISNIINTSNKCLEDRENIPGAPLWHMGKVAVFESKNSFDLLQNTIDYLACKGKLNKAFSDNEKEFIKEIFDAIWWGGKYYGYFEAVKLANHYVNGNGKMLSINPEVYKRSIIVSDAIASLKSYIRDRSARNKSIAFIRTGDVDFLRSDHALSLKRESKESQQIGVHIFRWGACVGTIES